jgi:molybdopterin-containing oxidoreductase family iron-sulfur binding subunit
VKTACQTACPTGAIEFGNIMDKEAVVTKKQADGLAYGMLSQLNIKPRTIYLAKVRNPHPRLMTSAQLRDLVEYAEPKHHGHHDDAHGDSGHGEQGHGDSSHGDHGHDPKAPAGKETAGAKH